MKCFYEVVPQTEPHGTGTGWAKCSEHEATVWAVYDWDHKEDYGLVAVRPTREAAEEFIRALAR